MSSGPRPPLVSSYSSPLPIPPPLHLWAQIDNDVDSTKTAGSPATLLSGSPSSPLAGLETAHDPWFDTFDTPPSSISRHKGYHSHHFVRRSKMDLGNSIGMDGSWRIEPNDGDSLKATMPWDDLARKGESLGQAEYGVHSLQPVNPIGEASTSAVGLFSTPVKETRRGDILRDKREKEKRPMPTAVWADLMDTSKGRDKVLKCVQYSLRTYLYLLSIIAAVRPLSPWFRANNKRMKLAVSGLSLTRKCLILFNPLHPLTDLLSPAPMSASTMLNHLLDLLSALADDLYCLNRLGIVNKRVGKKADEWSNRLWLLSTLIGLYKLHLKTIPNLRHKFLSLPPPSNTSMTTHTPIRGQSEETAKLRKAMTDAKWTNRKLLADLVFSSYDVFNLTWLSEPVHCVAGLAAAFIATSKLYDKQWISSMGK